MVANQTTEHTAWDCDLLKCGIPVPADQRKILTSGAGLSALQQSCVQTHLIAQVDALVKHMALHDRACCNELVEVRDGS